MRWPVKQLLSALGATPRHRFLKWVVLAAFVGVYLVLAYNYEMHRRESVLCLNRQLLNEIQASSGAEMPMQYEEVQRIRALRKRLRFSLFTEREVFYRALNADR